MKHSLMNFGMLRKIESETLLGVMICKLGFSEELEKDD
jgi:hypothetical protein